MKAEANGIAINYVVDGPEGAPPMFQCGNGTMLILYSREAPPAADHALASFAVDDIEKTCPW